MDKLSRGIIPSSKMNPVDVQKSKHFTAMVHVRDSIKGLEPEGVANLYADGFDELVASQQKGWLNFWEGRVIPNRATPGHTITKHVGRSDADIIAAGLTPQGTARLSSYSDVDMAEKVIAKFIQMKRNEIINWAKSNPSGMSINKGVNPVSEVVDMAPLAVGRTLDSSGQVVNATKAVVVLVADGRGGWQILTSYPTL
jgi:hypothetical protein